LARFCTSRAAPPSAPTHVEIAGSLAYGKIKKLKIKKK
jgi:hypothetical protein